MESLKVIVTLEDGLKFYDIPPEDLRELLARQVPGAFVILEHHEPTGQSSEFAQTCWDSLGSYVVEFRDATGHWQAKMNGVEEVWTFFLAWAAREPWRGKPDWVRIDKTRTSSA